MSVCIYMHESQDQTHWRHLIRGGHSDDFGGADRMPTLVFGVSSGHFR